LGWHPQSLEESERWPGEWSASQRNWVALGWWTYVTLVSLCACDGSGFVAQTHQGHGTRYPQRRIAWSMHFFSGCCACRRGHWAMVPIPCSGPIDGLVVAPLATPLHICWRLCRLGSPAMGQLSANQ